MTEDDVIQYKYLRSAKDTKNLKGCNRMANCTETKRVFNSMKIKPTISQVEEIERLNKLAIDNGLEQIPKWVLDGICESRKHIGWIMYQKGEELKAIGIDIRKNECHCGSCMFFEPTVGKAGICKQKKRTVRATNACNYGKKKEI